jgi:DNA polymerase-1
VSKAPFARCSECPLLEAPFVPSDPINPDAEYWIVGESPGTNEVIAARNGNPRPGFIGYSGKMLWNLLGKLGVERERDCNVTNAVLCQPPSEEKEDILEEAARCCRPRLLNEIEQTRSQKILALGKAARKQFFHEVEGESVTTMHGRWAVWAGAVTYSRWALATVHPAFVLRQPDEARTLIDDVSKFVKQQDPVIPELPRYEVVTTKERLYEVLELLANEGCVAFDLETNNINWFYDDILLMVLSAGSGKTFIIPGKHTTAPAELLYSTTNDECWKKFWSSDVTFVGHNAKFDCRFLRAQLLQDAHCNFDTMLAHYVTDERKGTHDLKGLLAQRFNIRDYEIGLKQYLKSRNDNYGKIPWDVLCQYAAWDGVGTWMLMFDLRRDLKASGQYDMPFMKMMMPLDEVLLRAELRGFHVDVPYLSSKGDEFRAELDKYTKEIKLLSGGKVQNLNSTKQLSAYLYDFLMLPRPKGRKLKPNSTNHDALVQLTGKHDSIRIIQAYRKIEKLRSSYVDNTLDMLDDVGDAHCDCKQHGAEHGRMSVEKPALQTLPRPYESPYSKVIRDAFIARPGYKLGVYDYSQAELRIAAALSNDPFLLRVYAEDRDLHGEVALAMFGPNFTKEQRVMCKMFNFSYLYGGNEYSFAMDVGLPISVAQQFVHDYDKVMPGLAAWKKAQWEQMKTYGYVGYRTGSRRRVPYIGEPNRDDARKASFNAPVAGQASHMTSMSAIRVDEHFRAQGWDAHVLLLVHDSIIVETREDLIDQVSQVVPRVMEQTASEWFPEVKWKAEAEIGDRWGSVKAYHPS